MVVDAELIQGWWEYFALFHNLMSCSVLDLHNRVHARHMEQQQSVWSEKINVLNFVYRELQAKAVVPLLV